jgi:hypothetical protein
MAKAIADGKNGQWQQWAMVDYNCQSWQWLVMAIMANNHSNGQE